MRHTDTEPAYKNASCRREPSIFAALIAELPCHATSAGRLRLNRRFGENKILVAAV